MGDLNGFTLEFTAEEVDCPCFLWMLTESRTPLTQPSANGLLTHTLRTRPALPGLGGRCSQRLDSTTYNAVADGSFVEGMYAVLERFD